MMLVIVNLILAFFSFIISLINLLMVKKKTKEVPPTWYYLSVGFLFIFLSQIAGFYRTVYQQPTYFLQYYTESVAIVGVFFILRGLLTYFGKSK